MEELEAAKAEIKRLTEQMGKLAHLANEKNAVIISEMYIADWNAIRAETEQARTQLTVANAIAELEIWVKGTTPKEWYECESNQYGK